MKLLLYCTKAKPMLKVAREDLFKHQDRARCYKQWEIKYFTQYVSEEMYEGNGKIVAECDFEIKKITDDRLARAISDEMFRIERDNLLKGSCLTGEEIKKYFNFYNWKFEKQDKVIGYAIHIKNLHIFDEPRELSEYMVYDKSYDNMFGWAFEEEEKYKPVNKAPQNMMRVWEDLESPRILISIKSEWLCKILNGEKTIEVRKKVLKEMI